MIALLALPWVRQAVTALAVLAAVLGGLAWLRMDAASDARNEVAVQAAQQEQETRHEGDKAARDAERVGAAERMRNGDF